MNFSVLLTALSLLSASLLADSSASYPPNPYEDVGGRKSPAFTAANSEAIHWLNLIDQQQYASSWGDAAPLFKDIISKDQWVAAMKGVRQPFGQVRTRKVNPSFRATQELPGGTRGNFIVIEYQTSFSAKPNAKETITLMTNQLNQWGVIAYTVSKS